MWYIIVSNSSNVSLIYLTSSKKKCIKKYKELEFEEYKYNKLFDGWELSNYYYGYYKKK